MQFSPAPLPFAELKPICEPYPPTTTQHLHQAGGSVLWFPKARGKQTSNGNVARKLK